MGVKVTLVLHDPPARKAQAQAQVLVSLRSAMPEPITVVVCGGLD